MQKHPGLALPGGRLPAGLSGHPTRRELLRHAFWLSSGVAGVAIAAGLERYLDAAPRPLVIEPSQIPLPGGEPQPFPESRFYLVNLLPGEGELHERPYRPTALSTNSAPGRLLALSWQCPRNEVPSVRLRSDLAFVGLRRVIDRITGNEGWLRCPICDSTFTRAGLNLFGTHGVPLTAIPIAERSDGSLVLDPRPKPWGSSWPRLPAHPTVDAVQHPLTYLLHSA